MGLATNDFAPCSFLPHGCHQSHLLPPELQLTHNNIVKDLLLISLLFQVTCCALVFDHTVEGKCVYEHAESMLELGFNPLSQGHVCINF